MAQASPYPSRHASTIQLDLFAGPAGVPFLRMQPLFCAPGLTVADVLVIAAPVWIEGQLRRLRPEICHLLLDHLDIALGALPEGQIPEATALVRDLAHLGAAIFPKRAEEFRWPGKPRHSAKLFIEYYLGPPPTARSPNEDLYGHHRYLVMPTVIYLLVGEVMSVLGPSDRLFFREVLSHGVRAWRVAAPQPTVTAWDWELWASRRGLTAQGR